MLQPSQLEVCRTVPPTANNNLLLSNVPSTSGPGSSLVGVITTCEPRQPTIEPDSAATWDRLVRARIGRFSFGLSPPGLMLVYLDWLVHLGFSPGKRLDLVRKFLRKALRFALYAGRSALRPDTPAAIEPLPQDQRFRDPAWRTWPFNLRAAFQFIQKNGSPRSFASTLSTRWCSPTATCRMSTSCTRLRRCKWRTGIGRYPMSSRMRQTRRAVCPLRGRIYPPELAGIVGIGASPSPRDGIRQPYC
jgi:hypothetical protein